MLKSMTGFGRAENNVGDKTFLVDIKSLNGKQFELQLRLPAILKPFEFDIRRLLSEKLGRGSIDCIISLKETGNIKPVTINTDLAKAYYKSLAELSTATEPGSFPYSEYAGKNAGSDHSQQRNT